MLLPKCSEHFYIIVRYIDDPTTNICFLQLYLHYVLNDVHHTFLFIKTIFIDNTIKILLDIIRTKLKQFMKLPIYMVGILLLR